MSLFRLNGFSIVAITAILLVAAVRRADPAGRRRLVPRSAWRSLHWNLVVYPADRSIQRLPPSLAYGPAFADLAVAYSEAPGQKLHRPGPSP